VAGGDLDAAQATPASKLVVTKVCLSICGCGLDDLGAFAAHAQHPMAVLLAKVGDVRAGGLEDAQAKRPEHRDQREVAGVR